MHANYHSFVNRYEFLPLQVILFNMVLRAIFASFFSSFCSSSLLIPQMAFVNYRDFLTNSSNPYYFHPNESPTLVLVSPQLDNKNYQYWTRPIHIALISNNKEKFVPKPNVSDSLYALWIRYNTMVLALLHCFIGEPIERSIL